MLHSDYTFDDWWAVFNIHAYFKKRRIHLWRKFLAGIIRLLKHFAALTSIKDDLEHIHGGYQMG